MRLPILKYESLEKIFDEKALVDLIGTVGYFSMPQICLNSAEVDLQKERKALFKDVEGSKKV